MGRVSAENTANRESSNYVKRQLGIKDDVIFFS
jgi:hypothetical protein